MPSSETSAATATPDYTAIGDTVNVAARLEANAKPGQILVSQAVMDIISPHVISALIGPLSLKGKQKPLPHMRSTRLQVCRSAVPAVERSISLKKLYCIPKLDELSQFIAFSEKIQCRI